MKGPRVTIVVTQREGFAFTRRGLESIYAHTTLPFHLIYVDAGSPRAIANYLRDQESKKGFRLLHHPKFISPNHARNLAIQEVQTEFVLFIDNDVDVEPQWLDKLIDCADGMGASIVGPLYLEGEPGSKRIHMAGGDFRIVDDGESQRFEDLHRFPHQELSDIGPLKRDRVDFVEFHCMLVRMDLINRIGGMDEGLLSLHEHVDFQLRAREERATVYIEPDVKITYVSQPRLSLKDLRYWMKRWSEAWNEASLRHFETKWGFELQHDWIIRFARKQRQIPLLPLIRAVTKPLPKRVGNKLVDEIVKREPSLNRLVWRSTAPGG